MARKSQSIESLGTSWRHSLRAANKSPKTIEVYLGAVAQFNAFLVEQGLATGVREIGRHEVEGYIGSRAARTESQRHCARLG